MAPRRTPFLEFDQELWERENQTWHRLQKPDDTLVPDREWPDARAALLAQECPKAFRVAPHELGGSVEWYRGAPNKATEML